MRTGEYAAVAPAITGLDEWVEGKVINIRKNPFLGTVIAIRDKMNRIFFGEEKYFKPIIIS
jgi:hypothetical protein